MKLIFPTTCALLATVVALGCNNSPPGGPGAANASNSHNPNTPENAFRLEAPTLPTDVKQGETRRVAIDVNRGTNFAQDVRLEFAGAPQGVKVTPDHSAIKMNENKVEVTIAAAKEAPLGDHAITVTGIPAKDGAKTSVQFKVHVQKAD